MVSFDGPKIRMSDGCYMYTKAIDAESSADISPYLSQIQQDSILNGKRVIIFDVAWDVEPLEPDGVKCKQRLCSVRLNTKKLCLFIKIQSLSRNNLKNLCQCFSSKFVTFVGVQIEEDLSLLKDSHGIVVRNVMDPGKLAAKVRGSPVLECLSARELAHRTLRYDMSRLDSIQSKWDEKGFNEHLEAAAIEGWLVHKVCDHLSV